MRCGKGGKGRGWMTEARRHGGTEARRDEEAARWGEPAVGLEAGAVWRAGKKRVWRGEVLVRFGISGPFDCVYDFRVKCGGRKKRPQTGPKPAPKRPQTDLFSTGFRPCCDEEVTEKRPPFDELCDVNVCSLGQQRWGSAGDFLAIRFSKSADWSVAQGRRF